MAGYNSRASHTPFPRDAESAETTAYAKFFFPTPKKKKKKVSGSTRL